MSDERTRIAREKPFTDHVREAVASYRRMSDTFTVEDLAAVLDAIYADRLERGWSCPPRAMVDAEIARRFGDIFERSAKYERSE